MAPLVEGQDLYVDDAFGAAHRAHASIVGPPGLLPSAAGRVLSCEVEVLDGLLDRPERPFVAVLGGAKVSDKLGVIEALLNRVDTLLVGGGMCFTFLAAQGHGTGASLLESGYVETCRSLLATAEARGKRILVPGGVVRRCRSTCRMSEPRHRTRHLAPTSKASLSGQQLEASYPERD